MGIDVYMSWKSQTSEERAKQITGFSVTAGHVGYLREAYHGEPYVTKYLVKEAFMSPEGKAKIPASVLRERLPFAVKLAIHREREIYHNPADENHPVVKAFVDFVELAEKKEAETGEPVEIEVSY